MLGVDAMLGARHIGLELARCAREELQGRTAPEARGWSARCPV